MLRRISYGYHVFFFRVDMTMTLSPCIDWRLSDDTVYLHPPCELGIITLLSSSLLHFFRIRSNLKSFSATACVHWADWLTVGGSGTAVENSPVHRSHRLGDSHPIQSIGVRHFTIVEPWAVACLPFVSTHHAELGSAAAFHMIAAFAQFDHGVALVAAFPAFFLGLLDKASDLRVLGAVGGSMKFSGAERTCFGLALRASGAFSTFLRMEIWWSNPDSASWIWAVDPVASMVLVVFLVEVDLEFEVEEVFHMR
jgi:hypothetical protein